MRKLILAVCMFLLSATMAWALPDVGSVVAQRGDTEIHRDNDTLKARVKDRIQLRDIIETQKKSRTKMLFIDESILTLGAESRASIEEFVYSKEGRGSSVFNLIDGYMRTVVGRNNFEVHTPSLVAAARGTVFVTTVGVLDGRPFTTITVLEGTVEVTSSDPSVEGMVVVHAGQSVTVFLGEPFPASAGPAPELVAGGVVHETDDETTTYIVPPMDQAPEQLTGWTRAPVDQPPVQQQECCYEEN